MTTVDVHHKPQSPSGGSPRTMRAELIAMLAAYTDDATTTVLGSEDFEPDSTGLVTMRLRPNSEMAQTGTYYRVRIARSEITYYAVVPDVGPVELVDILVDPTTLEPVGPVLPPLFQLRSERGQLGGYASLDGSGKVPSTQLPAGSGGGVESVNGDTGPDVVLDAADVGAPPTTRTVSGTAGRITGGGDLSDDRAFDLHADVIAALAAAGTAVQPAALTAGLAGKLNLSLFDAAGDLVVGSADNAATRLAKGSNGDVLSVVGGALTWVAPSSGASTEAPAWPATAAGFACWSGEPREWTLQSAFGNNDITWVRLYVPPGPNLTEAWVCVGTAGTQTPNGNVNGFKILSDDGATKLGETADTPALFTVAGWRGTALLVPIARPAGLMLHLGIVAGGVAGAKLLYPDNASTYDPLISAGTAEPLTARWRCASGSGGSLPDSINPVTGGGLTRSGYIPQVALR